MQEPSFHFSALGEGAKSWILLSFKLALGFESCRFRFPRAARCTSVEVCGAPGAQQRTRCSFFLPLFLFQRCSGSSNVNGCCQVPYMALRNGRRASQRDRFFSEGISDPRFREKGSGCFAHFFLSFFLISCFFFVRFQGRDRS